MDKQAIALHNYLVQYLVSPAPTTSKQQVEPKALGKWKWKWIWKGGFSSFLNQIRALPEGDRKKVLKGRHMRSETAPD